MLEDLQACERRAWEYALAATILRELPDVVVHGVPVTMVQTLHVLLHRDHVAQVVVDGSAEDWVVDNDPVYL